MNNFKNCFALTGGIGCGKSVALAIFKDLGCTVSDSDKICHEIYDSDPLFKKRLIDKWGLEILNEGRLDRKKIAEIVFNNENEKKWIDSILHPMIYEKLLSKIKTGKCNIVDVPLLYETKMEKEFKAVIAVWSDEETQYQRLYARNLSKEQIFQRIKAQLSKDKKLEYADYGLINTGNLNYLRNQCVELYNNYLNI